MPSPTPKQVAPKKTQQHTEEAPKGRSPVKRIDWYTPQRFEANVTKSIKQGQVLPLYKLVGEANLEPFVWLSIEGQADREDSKEFSPLRRGLEYIILKNQYNKYPMVELGIVVPEYRRSSEFEGADPDLDRPLRELRMGARFNVQWGYTSANTKWGAFTVVERQVSFDQGTALLVIKAKMGAKLTATTTSEVFSTTSPKQTITELAKIARQRIKIDEEIQKEIDQEAMNTLEVAPAGDVVGKAIQRVLALLDEDAWIDPQSDTLTISDPFKLDLVGKGIRPLKMTYGFPSSPIESLEIETKRPKRSGTGVRSSKGVKPTEGGIRAKTAKSFVKGSLVSTLNDGNSFFTHFGYPGVPRNQLPPGSAFKDKSAFSQVRDGTISKSNVIRNAEDVWKPTDGYKVTYNEQLNDLNPPGEKNYKHVLVERVFEVSGNFERTKDSLFQTQGLKRGSEAFDAAVRLHWATTDDIQNYVVGVKSGNQVYNIVGEPYLLDGRNYFPVEIYRPKKKSKNTSTPSLGDARGEDTARKSSTRTIEYRSDADIKFDRAMETINDFVRFKTVDQEWLQRYEEAPNKKRFLDVFAGNPKVVELKEFIKEREAIEKAVAGIPNYSLKQEVKRGGRVVLSVMKSSPRAPEQGAQPKQGTQNPANSASTDGTLRGSMTPASVSSGVARPSRRLTLTKLTIKLKAGDWAMRVGRLIELVDVYKSVDNIYFIDAEEHRIDENGFHTVITCKVATSRQKAKNKAISDGRTSERRAKAGDERQEVRDAQRKQESRPSSVILEDSDFLRTRKLNRYKEDRAFDVLKEKTRREDQDRARNPGVKFEGVFIVPNLDPLEGA